MFLDLQFFIQRFTKYFFENEIISFISFLFKATGSDRTIPKKAVRDAAKMREIQLWGERRFLKITPQKNTAPVQYRDTNISGKKVFTGSLRYLAEKGIINNTVLNNMKAPLIPATP